MVIPPAKLTFGSLVETSRSPSVMVRRPLTSKAPEIMISSLPETPVLLSVRLLNAWPAVVMVWSAAPSNVTVEVDGVKAVTPLQLPAILMAAAPEAVKVPAVKLPSISRVPVEMVMVPEFVALPVTFKVFEPMARVLEALLVKTPETVVVPVSKV